jgi:hypothetical protein
MAFSEMYGLDRRGIPMDVCILSEEKIKWTAKLGETYRE